MNSLRRDHFEFTLSSLQETLNNPEITHVMLYIVTDNLGNILGTITASLYKNNEVNQLPEALIEVNNTGVSRYAQTDSVLEILFDHVAQKAPQEMIRALEAQHNAKSVKEELISLRRNPAIFFNINTSKDQTDQQLDIAVKSLDKYGWDFADSHIINFPGFNFEGSRSHGGRTELKINLGSREMSYAKYFRLYQGLLTQGQSAVYTTTEYHELPEELLNILRDPCTILVNSSTPDTSDMRIPEEEWRTMNYGRNILRWIVRKTGIYYKILTPANEVLEYGHINTEETSGIAHRYTYVELVKQLNAGAYRQLPKNLKKKGLIAGKRLSA